MPDRCRALRCRRRKAAVGMRGRSPRLLPISGVHRSPRQSRHSAGGLSVMPSHQTPPSGVSATLVKMVFLRQRRHRVGLVFALVPGRRRRTRFGIDRAQLPVSRPA